MMHPIIRSKFLWYFFSCS